jgi:hypothetical protein
MLVCFIYIMLPCPVSMHCRTAHLCNSSWDATIHWKLWINELFPLCQGLPYSGCSAIHTPLPMMHKGWATHRCTSDADQSCGPKEPHKVAICCPKETFPQILHLCQYRNRKPNLQPHPRSIRAGHLVMRGLWQLLSKPSMEVLNTPHRQ